MSNHSHYVEEAKQKFLMEHTEFDMDASKDLDRLLDMARIHGAEKERYRILDKVRNKSAGIVVEAFGGDLKKMITLAGAKLAEDLERGTNA